MKKYLGTKQIEAREMTLGEYNKYKGWDIPKDEDPLKEGYLVQYSDSYISWSPKKAFEDSYREISGLNFGLAIEAVKMGKKIQRAGWNGQNQYVVLGTDFKYSTSEELEQNEEGHLDIGSTALVFVGTRGRQVGWLASQADMLADDWKIL